MRFLCLYRPGTATENDNPPTPDEIQRMGKLIQEMSQAGVLLATEGCRSSAHGARVRYDDGEFRVTDGPFPETKELIAGMCLLQVKSKAEAIEWTKRFLAVVREGEGEIRLLNEAPGA